MIQIMEARALGLAWPRSYFKPSTPSPPVIVLTGRFAGARFLTLGLDCCILICAGKEAKANVF